MARYYNRTRGPVPVQLLDGTSLIVPAKSWSEEINPSQEGSASIARAVRKGFLKRKKEFKVAPVPVPVPVPVIAPKPAPKPAKEVVKSVKTKVAAVSAEEVEQTSGESKPKTSKKTKNTSKRRK